ncbi:hypothetical protein A3I35_01070 [Candidatus Falkowbacteria bacterium RIFCSPLOWO2_02_FULL_45_15]|uniref:Uncharacterized protein n=2 Tax=Candidatus Falkowiibacteriota TaxID=1752728 RepID=A0A1F5RYJ2_9BACT|nr:MAG: hypothetical protein A3D54_01075 [Candidatus Falkowbacteria bacterium RIFCSPHIGHO2_02_FULL_45_15]OGF20000.1 MAG: hypothetical protein A3I35_01070 [Candidatus Falkowbacteria bacterium RIFCSPLOWO2_02_FULL_45_15]
MDNTTLKAAAAQEIDSLFERRRQRLRLWKDGVVIGVVIILLLMTFFQSIEIGRLRGYVQAANSVRAAAASASAPAASTNVGLPAQVGGC